MAEENITEKAKIFTEELNRLEQLANTLKQLTQPTVVQIFSNPEIKKTWEEFYSLYHKLGSDYCTPGIVDNRQLVDKYVSSLEGGVKRLHTILDDLQETFLETQEAEK